MELIGQHATLRPWRNADAASLVKYANNPNVARQLRDRFPIPTPPPTRGSSSSRSRRRARRRRSRSRAESKRFGGASVAASPAPTSSFRRSRLLARRAVLGPRHHRRSGPARSRPTPSTPATCCASSRCRSPTTCQSIRVLEKAGYTREAILRASSVKHGQPARPGALRAGQRELEGSLRLIGLWALGFGWAVRIRDDGCRKRTCRRSKRQSSQLCQVGVAWSSLVIP